jgi:XTP/dITP diphosphohydrolase
MDDVPTGQPALALTQKVYERVTAAGLPVDLIPDGLVSIAMASGGDAENALRSATMEFMDVVRKVEQAVAASRRPDDVPEVLDIAQLGVVTEEEWRAHWPTSDPEQPEESEEPAADEPEQHGEPEDPEERVDQENSVEPQ